MRRSPVSFGLILIDVRMPELDGPDFYRELQSRDPEHARRVMFMTGGLRAAVQRFFLAAQSFPGSRERRPDG